MIRSIRRIHRVVWLILMFLLPLLLLVGIGFRHDDPVNGAIPVIERDKAAESGK